jgi:AraC family transcriptional regulator of arabinose operon
MMYVLVSMPTRKDQISTNLVRDAKTFRPFLEFSKASHAQLEEWLLAVDIKAVSALEWQWPRHWIIESRVLSNSMYFWFERGSGKVWFGDPSNVYLFKTGDLILIPQGIQHGIEGTSNEEPHVYAVHFHASLFSGVDLISMLGFPLHLPRRAGAPYKQTSDQLVREYAIKAPGWTKSMANDIYSVLLYMIRNDADKFRPLATVDHQTHLPRLLPVLKWIEAHLSSNEVTIADLARQVYISETHFRRLFNNVFGMSPIQFIRRRRIERACTLLRTTDLPIKQVAQRCGFAEDAFFSRVFNRIVGTSPAAYRKADLL